jgi:NitT/TauT family transport system ATP-binding protein
MVSFENASFQTADGKSILHGINLRIASGERVALIGPSGCGKSTLFEMLVGFVRPSSGIAQIEGDQLDAQRCPESVGYIPQDSQEIVLPWLTCRKNINLAWKIRKDQGAAPFTPEQLLERTGLSSRADSFPVVLSGGEQRRVALSMVLSFNPALFLLDEPFTGVDLDLRFDLWDLLHDYQRMREHKPAMILITHSLEEAAILCDYAVFLKRATTGTFVNNTGKRRTEFPGNWSGSPRSLYRERATLRAYLTELDREFAAAIE